MKIAGSACLLYLLLITSCTEKQSTAQSSNTETWNLVSMTSGSMISDSTDTALAFQQTYSFNDDATFSKTQTGNGSKLQATGTYTKQNSAEGTYYTLKYATAHEIVGSCTGRDSETLLLRPDGKLQNSWMMCDGPFLVYEKQ